MKLIILLGMVLIIGGCNQEQVDYDHYLKVNAQKHCSSDNFTQKNDENQDDGGK